MIGIIAAMDIEAEKILADCIITDMRIVSGITFRVGTFCGKEIVVAVSGIGKVAAAVCTEAMILTFSPRLIINCGVGGALAKDLHCGDVVIASSAIQHDMDTSALGDPKGMISGINIIDIPCFVPKIGEIADGEGNIINISIRKIASGDKFIADRQEKIYIRELFSADVCEMEGAAIAHACFLSGIPCAIVRSISDSLEGDGVEYEIFKHRSAISSYNTVRSIVSQLDV